MNFIKNIIYNISDILLALIIIAVAVLVIGWRVDAIMSYPETLIEEQMANDVLEEMYSQENQEDNASGQTSEDPNSGAEQPADGSEAVSDQSPEGDVPAAVTPEAQIPTGDGSVVVTIEQGESLTSMADKMAAAGVVPDAQTFIEAVHAANATTKLKYGDFIIPAGSTPEAIIQIMM